MPFDGLDILDKLSFLLFEKIRYKVMHGGRGGGKSFAVADCCLSRMMSLRVVVVVCRELQTTIRDSIHRLFKERVAFYGLGDVFEITDNEIRCKHNGSILTYKHLHNNVAEVKGLESVDICILFEAEGVEYDSWKILDPTIRKAGSEIWIEFNPRYQDDFVYQRFVVSPPENARVVQINYDENPMCPQTLIDQAEECKRNRPEEYEHIWIGKPSGVGGLVYPSFDPGVHIRDVSLARIENVGNFFMGMDPHTAYYPFCVWMARVQKGSDEYEYYIYNEFPTVNMFGGKCYHELRKEKKCTITLKQRATMFQILDNTTDRTYSGIDIIGRGIDTRFAKGVGQASTTTNTRGLLVEMADPANGGLRFETPPERMIDVQRDRIRELLNYNKDLPLTQFNEPHLFVSPHCLNVIDSLKFHRFDKNLREAEDEKKKDAIDAIRICLATMQQYSHKDRSKKATNVMPGIDRVKELQEIFTGEGAYVKSSVWGDADGGGFVGAIG